jgi:hypothetical protein
MKLNFAANADDWIPIANATMIMSFFIFDSPVADSFDVVSFVLSNRCAIENETQFVDMRAILHFEIEKVPKPHQSRAANLVLI